jgi:hypothetical protein
MSDTITRSSSLSAGAADSGPAKTVEGAHICAVAHVVPTLLAASDDAERQSSAAAQDVPGIRRRNDNRSGCPNPDLDKNIQIWTSNLGRDEIHAVTSPSSKPVRDFQI